MPLWVGEGFYCPGAGQRAQLCRLLAGWQHQAAPELPASPQEPRAGASPHAGALVRAGATCVGLSYLVLELLDGLVVGAVVL